MRLFGLFSIQTYFAKRPEKYRLGFSLWWSASNTNWKNAAPTHKNWSKSQWLHLAVTIQSYVCQLVFQLQKPINLLKREEKKSWDVPAKVATTVKGH